MTLFWIIAAVMVVVALVLVIPPLLGRHSLRPGSPDESIELANHRERLFELANALEGGEITQEEFNTARGEIGNRLVVELSAPGAREKFTAPAGRLPAFTVAGLVPLAAVALYLWLGSSASLSPQSLTAPGAGGETPSVEEMVAGLAERLRDQPDDPQGWLMLARSYSVMERYPQARDAFAKAHELIGDQPRLLVDYAQAIALAQGNRLTGKPTELLTSALALEPDNQKGLWLAGYAARQNGDDSRAVALWQRLRRQLPTGSEDIAMVDDMIAQTGVTPSTEVTTDETAGPATVSMEVQVTLDPTLASRVNGSETLFIFARAIDGPPMPLAIQRRSAGELPLVVTLDDTMHMLPAFKLSNFPTVSVGARISRTGNATASSGDLQGFVTPVEVADGAVVYLVIEQVVD